MERTDTRARWLWWLLSAVLLVACGASTPAQPGTHSTGGHSHSTGGQSATTGSDASADASAQARNDGGAALGCVEIKVQLNAHPSPQPIIGGFWRSDLGAHLAWSTLDGFLVIATYDPETGKPIKESRLALGPNGAAYGGIEGIGFSPQGMFAVTYEYGTPTGVSAFKLALGHLDNPADTMSIDLFDEALSPGMYTNQIAWDGEAFAIHTSTRPEPDRYVTRVSPDGQIILPGKIFGNSGAEPSGIFAPDYSTDPVSGNTYMFYANFDSWAIGHDRAGNPFNWLAADSTGMLPLPGMSGAAAQAAVGADENGGAWLTWALDYNGDGTLGMMAYLNSQGQVEDPVEFGPVEPGGRAPADKQVVRGLSGGGAIAYSLGNDQLYVLTFSRGAIGVPRLLVQVAGATEMDARNYGDERWLGLHAWDLHHNDYLWFVKDIDGCVYSMSQ